MTNLNITRMLDQEVHDRAKAMQKVHDRNTELENENAALRIGYEQALEAGRRYREEADLLRREVADLLRRCERVEGALGRLCDSAEASSKIVDGLPVVSLTITLEEFFRARAALEGKAEGAELSPSEQEEGER